LAKGKKVDRKKILEKARRKEDKKKVTLYLSESLYEEFKEACDGIPASRVIEELLKDFVK
jgi:hypothetical protein